MTCHASNMMQDLVKPTHKPIAATIPQTLYEMSVRHYFYV